MTVHVMVQATIVEKEWEAFEEAYRKVTARVHGTPGHLDDRLIRDAEQPGRYVLLATWESEQAFRAWEDDPVHRQMAEPMYPYWANGGIVRTIFDVRATLDDLPHPA